MESKKLLPISIIILALSIAFGSVWIGYSLQKSANLKSSISTENMALTLSQVAEYLQMTEEEVTGIIQTEKKTLMQSGSFSGRMLSYFTVNNKQYFYRNEIDEWLKEVSINRREYDTTKGWILQ